MEGSYLEYPAQGSYSGDESVSVYVYIRGPAGAALNCVSSVLSFECMFFLLTYEFFTFQGMKRDKWL